MFPLGVLVVSLNGALSCQAEIYHAARGLIMLIGNSLQSGSGLDRRDR